MRTWWLESPPLAQWHMGRELSIWKRLIRLDSPELVNGAMEQLPALAPDVRRPYSLKLFYGRKSTPLYEQCKAEWLKRQGPPRPAKPRLTGASLRRIAVDPNLRAG